MGFSSDGVSHTVPSQENCPSVNTLQLVLCLSVGKQIFAGTAAAAAAADGRGGERVYLCGNLAPCRDVPGQHNHPKREWHDEL